MQNDKWALPFRALAPSLRAGRLAATMPDAKDRPLNSKFLRGVLFLVAAGSIDLAALAQAQQGVDCGRLQAQIASIDQANLHNNPYAGAAQKQRGEIERTRAYAQSIGCDKQQFLFFGGSPPPQCPSLQGRIQQMQANLAQLEANASHSGANPQRQDLVARYNAYCRGEQRQPGFFESLFGGGQNQPAPADLPPDQSIIAPTDEEQKPHGGSEAVCVRSCDGGFFPLNYSARRSNPENLTELCKALCPNTEAIVYTRVPGQEIQTSVSLDGTPYTDLPAALKFQKSFDAACTCRPAGQSWADALVGAERVLGHERKGDIIVTPEKSAEMSRPKPDAGQKAKVLQTAQPKQANADKMQQDDIESRDAASAAQVPTASKDSAGIATGEVKNGTAYPEGQGQTAEVAGPDGVKRRVRIVGPQL
jgi:hypothetical protein